MSKLFRRVTSIVIGILAFLFIVAVWMTVVSVSDYLKPYTISESSLIYDLKGSRYSDLVRDYHRNKALEADATETMEECYAVARYYEAVLDYQLALQEKDAGLQKKAEAAMEKAAGEMGDFSYAKGEIDELLSK